MNKIRLFGTFQKIRKKPDGTLIVSGIASSEAVDGDGEVIKSSAMKAAIPDYMRFGAVREMHLPIAAGVALKCEVMSDGKTHVRAKIVDPITIRKVESGVLKGFSIGGSITDRDNLDSSVVTGIVLDEISLVDRPSNPEALVLLCKVERVDCEGGKNKKNVTNDSAIQIAEIAETTVPTCDSEEIHTEKTEADKSKRNVGNRNTDFKSGKPDFAEDGGADDELCYETEDENDKPADEDDGTPHGTDMSEAGDCGEDEDDEAASSGEENSKLAKLLKSHNATHTRISELHSKLEKLQNELNELKKRPAMSRGILRAVGKGEDVIFGDVETDLRKQAEALDALPPMEQAVYITRTIHSRRP